MKVVTVHRGARDGYQVAKGLGEAGLLESLITDLYWPANRSWAQVIEKLTPQSLSKTLRLRAIDGVPEACVQACWSSGLYSFGASKMPWLSFQHQRRAVRWCDRSLGVRAGRTATARDAALLSYSYYGHSAFSAYEGRYPKMLFQLHPHPASVRSILKRERELCPECAASLDKEWELGLPEDEFRNLVEEPQMAEHCFVASSFTKATLAENGFPADKIHVIPYGIDLERFAPRRTARLKGEPLRLLFVGTLGQRKGLKYLLDAVELLPFGSVDLTVCGRPMDNLSLLRDRRVVLRLRPSISFAELLRAYGDSDVFVFPSLAEGFGHVLLEAMASGLPVISTDRTAAPDLIREGREGFVIGPGDPRQLAKGIEFFLARPEAVLSMGQAARARAELFTWPRFRANLAHSVEQVLRSTQSYSKHV